MSHAPLMYYRAIELATTEMLAAIRRGDWRMAMDLEESRTRLLTKLIEANGEHPLPAATQPAHAASEPPPRVVTLPVAKKLSDKHRCDEFLVIAQHTVH